MSTRLLEWLREGERGGGGDTNNSNYAVRKCKDHLKHRHLRLSQSILCRKVLAQACDGMKRDLRRRLLKQGRAHLQAGINIIDRRKIQLEGGGQAHTHPRWLSPGCPPWWHSVLRPSLFQNHLHWMKTSGPDSSASASVFAQGFHAE
jgi:hypothetical protein